MAYREIILAPNLTTKALTVTGTVTEGDTLTLRVEDVAGIGGTVTDWRLYLFDEAGTSAAELAASAAFAAAGDDATALIDTDTPAVRALFENAQQWTGGRRVYAQLYDFTNGYELAKGSLRMVYNPQLHTGDSAASGSVSTFTAGETLAAPCAVRVGSDGKLWRFVPSNITQNHTACGILTGAVQAGASATVRQFGLVTHSSWAWTAGAPVWVASNGTLSHTFPTDCEAVRVGVATGATSLLVCMGALGFKGQTGARGATGTTGGNGANGRDGTSGTDGTDGADGASMLVGSVVPTGSVGKNGDVYLDTATWTVYTRPAGIWGAVGSMAPQVSQVGTWVLAQIASSFGAIELPDNPTFDESINALRAAIVALKGG